MSAKQDLITAFKVMQAEAAEISALLKSLEAAEHRKAALNSSRKSAAQNARTDMANTNEQLKALGGDRQRSSKVLKALGIFR